MTEGSPMERLARLGLTLPEAAKPSFNYTPVTLHRGVAYVSGQLPKVDGEVRVFGKVGRDVALDAAREEARICVLQGLACLAAALGGLDRVERILKVTGFVASAEGFNDQPKVIDAASDLLVAIFEDAGRHARSAVGVAELPRNAAVEIEFVVAYRE
ncbi:RidA family protein [Chelatococcus sp. GCM10030263]|uniref:RidA family protein n=1 Tax=Chelatococcus sp. GCM10030263 TaxID=3273387 RepID=UPI00360BA2DA